MKRIEKGQEIGERGNEFWKNNYKKKKENKSKRKRRKTKKFELTESRSIYDYKLILGINSDWCRRISQNSVENWLENGWKKPTASGRQSRPQSDAKVDGKDRARNRHRNWCDGNSAQTPDPIARSTAPHQLQRIGIEQKRQKRKWLPLSRGGDARSGKSPTSANNQTRNEDKILMMKIMTIRIFKKR